jgi:hypothetical protein
LKNLIFLGKYSLCPHIALIPQNKIWQKRFIDDMRNSGDNYISVKEMSFLSVSFVNKRDLIPELLAILKGVDFCGYEPSVSGQLEDLLVNLKENISFVLEYPYVDRHYRDTYYSYHSSKFKKTGRNCIRVHIFEDEFTQNDLLYNKGLNGRYWGFFIIRPLTHYMLGRSLISPKAFKIDNFVCCLTKDRISLFGNEFTVDGFPHIAQDTETHTCAESSLWSFIEYFGSKYRHYKPLLPSQIITTLLNNSEHRILPSVGLTEKELAKCLNVNGFQCLIYPFASPSGRVLFFRLLKIYIESGIPLLLYLANEKDAHAVLVIGHETNNSVYDAEKCFRRSLEYSWIDASFIDKKLVFIDDNMPPYKIADLSHPTDHYHKPEMRNMVIKSFIVSLPVHMFLVAEKAYALMSEIFNDPKIGLQTFGGKWITRLLLTGSHSFKNFVYEYDNKLVSKLKEYLLRLALPKFVWICELYKSQDFNPNGFCSGLLIIDATSNGKSLEPVLWYTIDNQMFTHNNVAWSLKSKPIIPFKMCTYKNNLKGVWNQWKS